VSPGQWSWSPEALLGVLLAAAYLLAVRRYPAPAWRIACGLAACALIAVVFVTPVDTLARHYLVLLHLLQNVVLAEWAPLLLVLAVPPALGAVLGRLAAVRVLTHPFVALPVWIGTYVLWHVPALYDAALRRPGWLLVVEHLSYLATGLAVWWCVWQDEPHRLPSPARAGYVFAAFVLSAPLGLVLALVPEPIYGFYAGAPERAWGLSRLLDQQLGGITMASEQALVFFAVFAFWFLRFLAEQDRHELDGLGAEPPGPG
jgi:cytochrome c oxidase assembly factor CtaG